MRFRTEIERLPRLNLITPGTKLLLLGSCFADNIGRRLVRDGFNCIHNPIGPLFNPWSIANAIYAAASGKVYSREDLTKGPRGFHCLDYASIYSGQDIPKLTDAVNRDISLLRDTLNESCDRVVILTFGSAYCYKLDGIKPVGNCHKFPPNRMVRTRLDVDECTRLMQQSIALLPRGTKVILTVSPVRHLDEGLHGNTMIKAILHMACERLINNNDIIYFPAYEMLIDDLRDYRFYADDLKHPSEMASDYIYSIFCEFAMTPQAETFADDNRTKYLTNAHRPLHNDEADT